MAVETARAVQVLLYPTHPSDVIEWPYSPFFHPVAPPPRSGASQAKREYKANDLLAACLCCQSVNLAPLLLPSHACRCSMILGYEAL